MTPPFWTENAVWKKGLEKNEKNLKKLLTDFILFGRIIFAVETAARLERYRSGHNEAVLKTVCPQGRVGSNPTLSAGGQTSLPDNGI